MYCEMFADTPVDLGSVSEEDIDREMMRAAIMAELDAISFYEQMAAKTDNADLAEVLMDVAKEEKTHVGEFQTMLLHLDGEQEVELEEGRKEVMEDILGEG